MRDYIVVEGARIECEYGSVDSTFLEAEYHGCTIDDKNPILENNININDFVFCTLQKKACVFKSVEKNWRNTANFSIEDMQYITTNSVLLCQKGGMISVTNAGQNCVAEIDGVLVCVDPEL